MGLSCSKMVSARESTGDGEVAVVSSSKGANGASVWVERKVHAIPAGYCIRGVKKGHSVEQAPLKQAPEGWTAKKAAAALSAAGAEAAGGGHEGYEGNIVTSSTPVSPVVGENPGSAMVVDGATLEKCNRQAHVDEAPSLCRTMIVVPKEEGRVSGAAAVPERHRHDTHKSVEDPEVAMVSDRHGIILAMSNDQVHDDQPRLQVKTIEELKLESCEWVLDGLDAMMKAKASKARSNPFEHAGAHWCLSFVAGSANKYVVITLERHREEKVLGIKQAFRFRLCLVNVLNQKNSLIIDARHVFSEDQTAWDSGSLIRSSYCSSPEEGFACDGQLHGEIVIIKDDQSATLPTAPGCLLSPAGSRSMSGRESNMIRGYPHSGILSRMKVVSLMPRLVVFEEFITDEECDRLIEIARPHLKRSLVSGRAISENRTSSSMFMTGSLMNDPVVQAVDFRAIFYAGLLSNQVPEDRERLQIIRYQANQEFKAHYDNEVGDCSKRAATMLMNQLAKEANINVHNFPSFSKVALDLEAKIGHGQTPTTEGKKKTLPPNWKAKGRLMFVDNDGSTIELDGNLQEGVDAEAGGDTSEGGVVAAVTQQKGKGTGRRPRGSWSKSQTDPNAPPWEKAGLSEDVWRDRWARQACIKCGQYGHSMHKCRNRKVTEKIPPTMGSAVGSSQPVGSNIASSSGSAPGNTSGQ
ncbi:hypothetical protein CBR_g5682 [Chara braunii]|uniref:CCHC-type domain-containing protein n=1 Tax=Chara braunii TaxID=69332 RepID=A0A388JRS8_CHABU|nr:hypothetical protein CBR_g5682 [Chara braunii]|eukprot:GBG60506.1 hypothetical protein CBR_g5682 [Chara braunii]